MTTARPGGGGRRVKDLLRRLKVMQKQSTKKKRGRDREEKDDEGSFCFPLSKTMRGKGEKRGKGNDKSLFP